MDSNLTLEQYYQLTAISMRMNGSFLRREIIFIKKSIRPRENEPQKKSNEAQKTTRQLLT
jgi:hypothetical protein